MVSWPTYTKFVVSDNFLYGLFERVPKNKFWKFKYYTMKNLKCLTQK